MSHQKRKAPRGFTLIELVIVIAVIAILAALLVPTILNQTERARESRAKGEVAEIAHALSRMRSDTSSTTAACYQTLTNLNLSTVPTNCNPTTGAALTPCTTQNIGHICWNGPYMSQPVNDDPWDDLYVVNYTAPAAGTSTGVIQVLSYGPDKTNQITSQTDCSSSSDDICVIQ